ncbi:MAG: hypothetical protein Q8O89_08015 [Nanoarchaeota archaeon]|nr:hypothetical protein [Nanoarchaeota archaeon]
MIEQCLDDLVDREHAGEQPDNLRSNYHKTKYHETKYPETRFTRLADYVCESMEKYIGRVVGRYFDTLLSGLKRIGVARELTDDELNELHRKDREKQERKKDKRNTAVTKL